MAAKARAAGGVMVLGNVAQTGMPAAALVASKHSGGGHSEEHHHHHGKHEDRNERRNKHKEEEEEDDEQHWGKKKSVRSKLIGDEVEDAPESEAIGNAMDEYLETKVRRYQLQGLSRSDAVRKALLKAKSKRYPVVDSDPGYGYGSVLAALDTTHGQFEIKIGGGAVLKSAGCHHLSDNEVRISFGVPSALRVPMQGQYELEGRFGASGERYNTSGYYDLGSRGVCPNSQCHQVHLPLYRNKKLERIAKYKLPHSELQATVETDSELASVLLRQMDLAVHLSPSVPALLDPRSSVPASSTRSALEPTRYLMGSTPADDPRSSECASIPGGLDAKMARILDGRIGAGPSFVYRFESHVGRQQLCAHGRTADSHQHFYRLGQCTETLSVAALCAYIQEHAAHEFGHQQVRMHDHELTAHMLTCAGAHHVLEGLKKCYAFLGRARIPSPYELMNHCSGLPENFDAGCDMLSAVLKSAEGPSGAEATSAEHYEKVLGQMFERHCKPLYEPGGDYHYSRLNFAILRMMIADWKTSPHSCPYLTAECAPLLGMPTMCFAGDTQAAVAAHAPSCPSAPSLGCAPIAHGEPESPIHVLSSGGSCRIGELAAWLAASGSASKHSWTQCPGKKYEGHPRFSFLPSIVQPRNCIDREAAVYHGYGFDHVGLKCQGFDKHGLRALIRVGYTPTHHVVIMVMVPSLSLSFALGTNADLSTLLAEGSIVPFITEIVTAHIQHLGPLESVDLKRAALFNHVLNRQLCAAPAPGAAVSRHVRHCAHKHAVFAKRDPLLDQVCNESFLSLSDMRHSPAALKAPGSTTTIAPEQYMSPVTLSIEHKEAASGRGGSYYVHERHAHGEVHSYAIAYDADAFRSQDAARAAFEAHSRGQSLDKRECGMYRAIQPTHRLLGEFLEFATVEINASNVSAAGSMPQLIKATVISFRGRLFVRGGLYEMVRRKLVPSVQENVSIMLAGTKQSPIINPELSADEQFESAIAAASAAHIGNKLSSALRANAKVPAAQSIAPGRGGGGFRGGGGGYRGGWGYGGGYRPGWGYGGAVLGGALLGAAVAPGYWAGYGGVGPYYGCPPACRRCGPLGCTCVC